MDKEKLIKHHFWILLTLAVLLLPVVMGSVMMGVAEATAAKAKEVEKQQTELKNATGKAKGETYVTALEEQKAELEGSKGKVWEENYKKQEGLIEWPRQLAHLNKLYFGDPIPDEDINTFRKSEVYLSEFTSLAELIKPTELNGGWQQVMSNVKWGEKTPSNEEVWLALEDICIQREILRCIDDVNKLLSRFEKVSSPEVKEELKRDLKPAADETVCRFESPYWRLDLAIGRPTAGRPVDRRLVKGGAGEFVVRGQMKNKSQHRLNVGRIDFLVSLFDPKENRGQPSLLSVEGDYLSVEGMGQATPDAPKPPPAPAKPAEGDELPGIDLSNNVPTKTDSVITFRDKMLYASVRTGEAKPNIFSVEQKLDPRYVPVKRVDRIALGYNSHRTADKPLLLCPMSEDAKKNLPAAPEAAPAGGAPAPNAAASTSADLTPNKINRARYIKVSREVRRMPIGLVLIVDQAHVQDVLRAFANSRLRFQTTQFHCMRYRGGSTSAPAAGQSATEDPNANLVEMSLYGLASIYEKFPPKGEVAKQ
ncbi:MAG: hypothetical protein ACJ8C4_21375 [Gemmataceae bacterium]